jgi:hypothetical protein
MPYNIGSSKMVGRSSPEGTLNVQAYAEAQFPEEDPHWDPNDD